MSGKTKAPQVPENQEQEKGKRKGRALRTCHSHGPKSKGPDEVRKDQRNTRLRAPRLAERSRVAVGLGFTRMCAIEACYTRDDRRPHTVARWGSMADESRGVVRPDPIERRRGCAMAECGIRFSGTSHTDRRGRLLTASTTMVYHGMAMGNRPDGRQHDARGGRPYTKYESSLTLRWTAHLTSPL